MKNNRAGEITAFPGAYCVHITDLFAAFYLAGVPLNRFMNRHWPRPVTFVVRVTMILPSGLSIVRSFTSNNPASMKDVGGDPLSKFTCLRFVAPGDESIEAGFRNDIQSLGI